MNKSTKALCVIVLCCYSYFVVGNLHGTPLFVPAFIILLLTTSCLCLCDIKESLIKIVNETTDYLTRLEEDLEQLKEKNDQLQRIWDEFNEKLEKT